MMRPVSDPHWLEALRRPVAGPPDRSGAARRLGRSTCGRCRRPADSLESWLERRRLRIPDRRAPGGFRYSHQICEHLVCGPCYLEIRNGRPPVKTSAYKITGLATLLALLAALALPLAMPDIVAAFWRNGAASSGWREHHVGLLHGLQGRF